MTTRPVPTPPIPDGCPRCDSDTCPGREDVLDCQVSIGGQRGADEARDLLLARLNGKPIAVRPPVYTTVESPHGGIGAPLLACATLVALVLIICGTIVELAG